MSMPLSKPTCIICFKVNCVKVWIRKVHWTASNIANKSAHCNAVSGFLDATLLSKTHSLSLTEQCQTIKLISFQSNIMPVQSFIAVSKSCQTFCIKRFGVVAHTSACNHLCVFCCKIFECAVLMVFSVQLKALKTAVEILNLKRWFWISTSQSQKLSTIKRQQLALLDIQKFLWSSDDDWIINRAIRHISYIAVKHDCCIWKMAMVSQFQTLTLQEVNNAKLLLMVFSVQLKALKTAVEILNSLVLHLMQVHWSQGLKPSDKHL